MKTWALPLVLAWGVGCNRPEAKPSGDGSASSSPTASVGPASPTADSVGSGSAEGAVVVGNQAPEFSVMAHTGETVRLSGLRGKVVILYFYPKDGTPGCTTEAEQFRDHHQALEGAGAVVLGVSADGNDSHRDFARELGLPFLLLPDPERSLARTYGVGGFLGMSKRVTFLIDREGRIAKIYPGVSPKEHAAQVVSDLASLGLGRAASTAP